MDQLNFLRSLEPQNFQGTSLREGHTMLLNIRINMGMWGQSFRDDGSNHDDDLRGVHPTRRLVDNGTENW